MSQNTLLTVYLFKKYFGPNEIILTFSVSLHEIAKVALHL